MRQLARRASLVVVMLLASVATASAECAWVLWYQSVTEASTRADAFDTRAACIQALERSQRQYGEARAQRTSETVLLVVNPGDRWRKEEGYARPGSEAGFRLDCLHDTIDPRAPKP